MADDKQSPTGVDETPISPNRLERRDSLEKHLQLRPEAQDLKNRNILLNTNAAPFVNKLAASMEANNITVLCKPLSKSWNASKLQTT